MEKNHYRMMQGDLLGWTQCPGCLLFLMLSHINTCCCHEYLLGTRSLTDFRDWILFLNSLTYNGNCASAKSQSVHVGLGLMLTYDGGGL